MQTLKNKARELRNNMTDQERKLWQILKNRNFLGLRFLRQYVIGNYIVDFICKSRQIIIEIDGGQHNQARNIGYDNKRTLFLEAMGYKVIRFWNNEIDNNFEGVYEKLLEEFN